MVTVRNQGHLPPDDQRMYERIFIVTGVESLLESCYMYLILYHHLAYLELLRIEFFSFNLREVQMTLFFLFFYLQTSSYF